MTKSKKHSETPMNADQTSSHLYRNKGKSSLRAIRAALFCSSIVLLYAQPATADSVGNLVHKLKSASNYKVRLTAALVLRKSCDPRAFKALIIAVKSDKNSLVRSTAASALASMGLPKAAPALRKAAKSRDRNLKKRARRALARLCPKNTRGIRRYINLDRISYKGPPKGKIAIAMVRCRLARALRKRRSMTVSWKRCRKPSKRQLRRKRVKGYYLDVVVKLKAVGSTVKCKISPTLFTYPRAKLLTTGGGTVVKVQGGLNASTISTCFKHAVNSTKGGIIQTLERL
jgi:hypothetical protein